MGLCLGSSTRRWNYSSGGIVCSSNGNLPESLPNNIVVNGGYIGEFSKAAYNHNNVGALVFKNVGEASVSGVRVRPNADKTDSNEAKYAGVRVFSGDTATLAQSGTISCTDMDIKGCGYLAMLDDDGCKEFKLQGRFEDYRFPVYANTSTGTIDRVEVAGYFKGANGNHLFQAHPDCNTINKVVCDSTEIGNNATGSAAVNLGSSSSDIVGDLVYKGDCDFNGNTKHGNVHANTTVTENGA